MNRDGQIIGWVLAAVGVGISIASLTYGATSSSYKDQILGVTNRQNALDTAVITLTKIESQNATLIQIYGEQIKDLQNKK